MFSKELFELKKQARVNICMESGISHIGNIVECSNNYLLLESNYIGKHYLSLDKIESFYFFDDRKYI